MPREEAEFGAECKSQKAMGIEERLCIPPVENIRACTQSEMPLLDKQQPFIFSQPHFFPLKNKIKLANWCDSAPELAFLEVTLPV